MTNKIRTDNNILQFAIDSAIERLKDHLNIDVENEIIHEAIRTEFDIEMDCLFDDYEVYNEKLFDIAQELYAKGYNFLETAAEFDKTDLMIVNETLKEFVLDIINEHQEELKKQQKSKG